MSETGEQMIEAAKKGDVETVKKLLKEGADVHYADEDNRTALHWAAIRSAADVCEVLLAHRANVDAEDKYNHTALHLAAKWSAADVCEVLIAHRANVDAEDYLNHTALHLAAENSAADVCEVLLAHRANVDAENKYNCTALHLAASNSAADVCEVLLAHRANVDAEDYRQRTPIHRACEKYNYATSSDSLERLSVVILLIQSKANITSKDEDGKTPLDYLGVFKRRTVQQEYEKFNIHHKLMETSSRPMEVVKICLCGDPAAGKSTIKYTLTKKLSLLTRFGLGRALGSPKKREDGGHVPTPGINVSRQSVPGAGNFVLWDCAGQKEYSLTHGMFLGATAQSIFVVMYDLTSPQSKLSIIEYWLPFIRAMHGKGEEKPQVVLVGTHLDEVENPRQGERDGSFVINRAKERFSDTLVIDDTIIVVDAREGDGEGMAKLKAVLKSRRKEMIKNKTVPKLCDKVLALIKSKRHTDVPIIGWDEYLHLVKNKYVGIDEDTLKLVTGSLHLQGEIYWAKFTTTREDQIILNTQWFTTDIIGAAFAGDAFGSQLKTLPDRSYYTLEELREFFPKMDTSRLLALLDDMDLLHVTSDERYLLPGKLPLATDVDAWVTHDAYELKGRSIKCVHKADIFNPLVFPALQKKMLDMYGDSCQVWQSAVLCIFGRVEVYTMLTKHKRAIQIVVKCPTTEDRKVSHGKLEDVVELIQSELFQKSKGTIVQFGYMSPNALRQHQDLEEVLSFSQEKLMIAEELSGVIGTQEEDITQILFNGYDDMFLLKFGLNCRYDWLPVSAADRCFHHRLDRSSEWGEDYRAVGQALGIQDQDIERLADSSRRHDESPTKHIINQWCEDRKRKMSIGMLQQLLSRLSLLHNADALIAVDEVVEEYTSHLMKSEALTGPEASSDVYASHDADSAFNVDVTGSTDKLVRWRLVLKRRWDIVVRDLVTNNGITSSLLYLHDCDCQVLGELDQSEEQRQKNSKKLLKLLLHRKEDSWPDDFLLGLRETGQSLLANALSEEYQKVEKEEEERCKKRRLTQRAFYKSINHEEKTKERTGHEDFSNVCASHAVDSSSEFVSPKVADRFPVKGASVYHSNVNMEPSSQSAPRPTVSSDSSPYSHASSSTKEVTERDVLDIVNIFALADLDEVYTRLGLTRKDVKDSTLMDIHNPKKQAKNLLYLWCDRNGEEASRGAFIQAVERCKDCKAALDELKREWNI